MKIGVGLVCVYVAFSIAMAIFSFTSNKSNQFESSAELDSGSFQRNDPSSTFLLENNTFDSMNVITIVTGPIYTKQVQTMITSLLLFTETPANFYIVTNPDSIQALKSYQQEVARQLCDKCRFHFFNIDESFDRALSRFKLSKVEFISNASKELMFKVLVPEFFNNLDALLFIDTDVILLGDVSELWAELKNFAPQEVVGMGPEGYTYLKTTNKQKFVGQFGLNYGVNLINAAHGRAVNFSAHLIEHVQRHRDVVTSHHDQGFLNAYLHDNPAHAHVVACDLIFHGDIDGCSYVNHTLFRNCNRTRQNGALMIHATTGRFLHPDDVSRTQREHLQGYVLGAGAQPEYGFLSEFFGSLTSRKELTDQMVSSLVRRFSELRRGYCGKCEECTSGEDLLKRLHARPRLRT